MNDKTNELPEINQRIQSLIEELANGNVAEFVRMTKISSHQVLNRIFSIDQRTGKYPSPSAAILSNIKINLPQVDYDWLLTGEGSMLKDDGGDLPVTSGKLIPFYDAEAVAGGSDYEVSVAPAHPVSMIEIGALLKDSESALRVYGNSMVPNYPAGCVVGLRRHTESFIEPGYVYVIETSENRYLKRIYATKDKVAIRCVSDNHMAHESGPMTGELYYPEFEIPFKEINRIFRVVGVIKRNVL